MSPPLLSVVVPVFNEEVVLPEFHRVLTAVLSTPNGPDYEVVFVNDGSTDGTAARRGLVSWIGFRQIGLPFDRPPRAAGETKFSLWKMVRFALDGLTSFSHLPLRLVTAAGFTASVVSLALLGWVVYVKWIAQRTVPGWTSLIGVVLLLGGAQLLALGVIGEYIARIYDEAKRRPLYLIRRSVGRSGEDPGAAPPGRPTGPRP